MTEIDETLLLQFNTEKEKIDYLEKLECWEQEHYAQTKENYYKCSMFIRKDLLTAHVLLHSLLHLSLYNRL